MCFKPKIKTPKVDPNKIPAPEPIPLEEPKGIDFGAEDEDNSTDNKARIEREGTSTEVGSALSTAKAPSKSTTVTTSSVRKALSKKRKG